MRMIRAGLLLFLIGCGWAKAAEKPLAFPAAPAGASAGLEGAFLRVETYMSGSSLVTSTEGWFFTKSGRFSRGPRGGHDPREFAEAAPTKSDGTYWIADGQITFAFADGSKPRSYKFERKGENIVWNGIIATRAQPWPKGTRLEGTYSGGASIGGGAIASSNTIVFRRDGTFGQSATGTAVSAGERSTVTAGSSSSGEGRYEFDGYTLTLTMADGTVKKFTSFAWGERDGTGRPEYIYRDGRLMNRKG